MSENSVVQNGSENEPVQEQSNVENVPAIQTLGAHSSNTDTPVVPKEQKMTIEGIPLFGGYKTEDGELFVAFSDEKGRYSVASVRSKTFKRFIRYVNYKVSGKILKDSEVREISEQVAAYCDFQGDQVTLSNRVAKDDDKIVVDGVSNVYSISPGKWEMVSVNRPLFKRPNGMKELPMPVSGGDLTKFLDFVNLRNEESKLLFLVHVVASFIPDIPHPPMVCFGPQGSSKSTILRYYSSLVDPNMAEDVPFRNEKDFMLTANQRWVLGLDNVSFLDANVSDIFCKLVTGACYTARVLYTDEDLLIRRFRRVVIINGINLPVDKPDLMDRCLLMPMERIAPERRQAESDLNAKFESIKGELLGGCFDVLSKAMEIRPTVVLPNKERMADFHVWGCAIAQALGYTQQDFLNAWAKNIELQHEEALEASPLATLVMEWFKSNPYQQFITGTPSVVFRKLKEQADNAGIDERSLPRSPLAFGRKLQEVRSNLEAHGYVIDRTRGKNRTITIHKPKSSVSASIASVPSVASGVPQPESSRPSLLTPFLKGYENTAAH